MATAPRRVDVLIRRASSSDGFELIEAVTHQPLAMVASLLEAVQMASAHAGAVWRQNTDNRGRALGDPVLLLPRRTL